MLDRFKLVIITNCGKIRNTQYHAQEDDPPHSSTKYGDEIVGQTIGKFEARVGWGG
jgi:hypothetical protein